MKDYAIQVHGLKGNARTLGADQLADMAFAHEEQSKAGNLEYVKKHWQELLLIWENTLDGFQEFINTYGGKQLDKYSAVSGDGSGDNGTGNPYLQRLYQRRAPVLYRGICRLGAGADLPLRDYLYHSFDGRGM